MIRCTIRTSGRFHVVGCDHEEMNWSCTVAKVRVAERSNCQTTEPTSPICSMILGHREEKGAVAN